MQPLNIPAAETGVIRVFALNQTGEALATLIAATSRSAVVEGLTGQTLPETGYELIALEDIASIGLPVYLAQGYGVPEPQLKSSNARLAALEGYVLLIFSSAFEGASAILQPSPSLSLIATLGEAAPDTAPTALTAEAAKPYTGTAPDQTTGVPSRNRAGSLVVAVLIVIVAVILWLVLG